MNITSYQEHCLFCHLLVAQSQISISSCSFLRVGIFSRLFNLCLAVAMCIAVDARRSHRRKITYSFVGRFMPASYEYKPGMSYSRPTLSQLNLELQNPSLDVPELHKICRSPDLEALKLYKGRSGYTVHKNDALAFLIVECLCVQNIYFSTTQIKSSALLHSIFFFFSL